LLKKPIQVSRVYPLNAATLKTFGNKVMQF
jgi:hypothetical protein